MSSVRPDTALVVIDVQEWFRHRPYWDPTEVPAFLASLQELVDGAQAHGIPVLQVFHLEDQGPFSLASGNVVTLSGLSIAPTAVFYKRRHSALIGTGLVDELREVLEDRVGLAEQILPVPAWPLALHRHYSRREIAAAVGYIEAGDKNISLQGGILQLEGQRELLFVTLDKSGKGFSPTTRYRDYAISPELFHWETQAAASVTRPSGRRYLDNATNGWSFFPFVRTDPEAAFAFLGPIRYEAHAGDRPIAITWRLASPMPAALYERYATLRPG